MMKLSNENALVMDFIARASTRDSLLRVHRLIIPRLVAHTGFVAGLLDHERGFHSTTRAGMPRCCGQDTQVAQRAGSQDGTHP